MSDEQLSRWRAAGWDQQIVLRGLGATAASRREAWLEAACRALAGLSRGRTVPEMLTDLLGSIAVEASASGAAIATTNARSATVHAELGVIDLQLFTAVCGVESLPRLIRDVHGPTTLLFGIETGFGARAVVALNLVRASDVELIYEDLQCLRGPLTELLAVHESRGDSPAPENERSELLQMFVHDVRSPTAAIIADLEYLRFGEHGEETRALLSEMEQAAREVDRLAEQMLVLARMDAHQPVATVDYVDPIGLTRRLVDRHRHHAEAQGCQLAFHASEYVIALYTDESLVGRVVENFIANAMKHTRAGARIDVSVEISATAPRQVRICVEDDGPGVAPELEERLFTPWAVSSPRQGNKRSTGLGLAFCRRVADLLGAKVGYARSTLGGAAFTLWLPERVPCRRSSAPANSFKPG